MKSTHANTALKPMSETTSEDDTLVVVGAQSRQSDVRRLLRTAASSLMLAEADLCQSMLDVVFATTPATQGSVMLRDGNELEVVAAHGHTVAIVGARMPRGRGVAWSVVESGHELHVFGVFSGGRRNYDSSRCAIVVPIVRQGEIIGTINLNRQQEGFSEAEFRWIRVVAEVLGRCLAVGACVKDEVHPWWRSPQQCMMDMLSDDPTAQQARQQTSEFAQTFARILRLGDMAPRICLAASYMNLAELLVPDEALAEIAATEDIDRILREASGTLLATFGVDEDVCEILSYSDEPWDGEEPQASSHPSIPTLSRLLVLAAEAVRCARERQQ